MLSFRFVVGGLGRPRATFALFGLGVLLLVLGQAGLRAGAQEADPVVALAAPGGAQDPDGVKAGRVIELFVAGTAPSPSAQVVTPAFSKGKILCALLQRTDGNPYTVDIKSATCFFGYKMADGSFQTLGTLPLATAPTGKTNPTMSTSKKIARIVFTSPDPATSNWYTLPAGATEAIQIIPIDANEANLPPTSPFPVVPIDVEPCP